MQDKNFDAKRIKAIIGLGNPGPTYYKTRHSIGFRVVDEIARRYDISFIKFDDKEYAQVNICGSSVYILKPLTFMNKSGEVIHFLLKKGIKPEEILVVHDELEKSFGDISIKFGGSAKGHNGLKSIINMIGQDFWRLRFGIGRPDNKDDVSAYVLSHFSTQEECEVPNLIDKAICLFIK